jgi:sodium-independent sulfate anion transporter 11
VRALTYNPGFVYSNAAHYTEYLVAHIFQTTRPTNPALMPEAGDRPWNDPGPKKGSAAAADTRPTLKAIILDFSSVNNVDITSVQNLIDVRNQLDRHASPEKVEWHFAAVNNRWTKRALAAAGFGFPTEEFKAGKKGWTPVFSVAESVEIPTEEIDEEKKGFDEEAGKPLTSESTRSSNEVGLASPVLAAGGPRRKVLGSVKRPFFHPDIDGALQSVIRSIEG